MYFTRWQTVAKVSIKRHTSNVRQDTHYNDSQRSEDTHTNKKTSTHALPDHVLPGQGLIKSQTEAATYIADMVAILRNIARDVDLKFLNYLLEMAYEESLSRTHKTPKGVKSQTQ